MPTSLKYPYANYSLRTIPQSMFCAWVDDAHCPLKTSIMVIIYYKLNFTAKNVFEE